ncbi:MAG: sigma-70 family RNA polymerase sigma factor [Patescibacteria group bacterium]
MKEEELLVKKAQEGNADAFGKLYDTHMPRIFRFIVLKVGAKHDAEDLTQQVFINAWQHLPNFEFKGFPFSSWLYRIASNAVIDYYRTARPTYDIEKVPEELVARTAAMENELDHSFGMETIKIALAKLDPEHQNVLILRFVEDRSTKEIAELIEKSEGAVRVIQHRALKTLKSIVDGKQYRSTIKEA